MTINTIESTASWVAPLQIAHKAMSIHSASERLISQVTNHICKAVFVKSRLAQGIVSRFMLFVWGDKSKILLIKKASAKNDKNWK